MMMPWAGGSAWTVLGPLLGAGMLAVAVLIIVVMYRDPRPTGTEPGRRPEPPHDVDGDEGGRPVVPDSSPRPDTPEARAARGEMDADQLHREQRRTS